MGHGCKYSFLPPLFTGLTILVISCLLSYTTSPSWKGPPLRAEKNCFPGSSLSKFFSFMVGGSSFLSEKTLLNNEEKNILQNCILRNKFLPLSVELPWQRKQKDLVELSPLQGYPLPLALWNRYCLWELLSCWHIPFKNNWYI